MFLEPDAKVVYRQITSPERKRLQKAQEGIAQIMATDTVIAKRGDVIIKLGKEGQATTNARVSSTVLSLASPVFEARFSGRFAEGQALSIDAPREVPLPEDDLQSMLLICKITHLRTAGLPDKISVDDFASFAGVCDKYQCIETV